MAEISKLLEILRDGKPPRNLLTRLRSGPIRPGLVWLNSALRCGTKLDEDGKLGLESWSPEQIGAVVSVAKMIVSASLSISVESLEPAVIAIIKNSLEFCTCFLESSKFDEQDFCLKNDVAQLMEILLVDGIGDVFNSTLCHSECAFPKSVLVAPDDLDGVVATDSLICIFQGIDCLKDKKEVDMGLTTLESGFLPLDAPVTQSAEHTRPRSPSSTISFAQHWGVVHVKCFPRLLLVSQELIRVPSSSGDLTKDCSFHLRNSLSLRILKLLGNLIKDIPPVTIDSDLLNAVLCYANNLVTFFRHEFDFTYHEAITSENAFEAQLLWLLEEFIHLVQIAFRDDIFENIRTCVLASIFDIFDVNSWRYNRSSSSLKPPLAYCPKLIMYLLKLIKEIKDQNTQAFDWKKFDVVPLSSDLDSDTSWDIHSEKVFLLRKYLPDEHLRIIFPSTKQWMDNLMHLADFLHSEGINSRLKVDRLRPGHTKTVVTSEVDSTLTHEDEALFGNLFSEASRPAVSPSGQHDQPLTGCISNLNSHHLLIHAAIEVFNFLRTCIFSPEWHALIYEDACKKLNESHINSILSTLVRQSSLSDEGNTVLSQRTSGNLTEICFELLHNLLVRHALSIDLEDHLVDEVLKVANGKYVYNDHTLMLLIRALISRTGVTFHQIARKIYKGFIEFILEKVKNVHSRCDDIREFVDTLPSIFHLEILLMTFHLSSTTEKAVLARLVLSSLRSLDPPPSACNGKQLSCWGLLVSRLVLLIQHFLLYTLACPPWLPLQLRSLLRGTLSRTSFYHSLNDHAASRVATTLVNFSNFIKELPTTSSLLPQLFDFNSCSTVINQSDRGLQTLGLDVNELLTSLTWIVGFWRGKKVEAVEDLILERYVFLLCWNTVSVISGSDSSSIIMEINWENLESLDIKYFFLFGHFLLRNNTIISEDINLGTVALSLLKKLSSQKITYQTVEQGWDFLRNGAWLSLLLSMLRTGLWRYSMKNAIHGVEPYWIEQIPEDNQFLFSSEIVIEKIFEGNYAGCLIKALSSCLNECLVASQEAFFLTFDPRNRSRHVFSPSLFLRYVWFNRYKQSELVPKDDLNSSDMESFMSFLSKLNETFLRENGGNMFPFILRSTLHGLPLHTEISSTVLISCILNVQDIVSTLDSLLKSRDIWWNFNVQDDVIRQLISSLMEIKSDRIFDDLHDKCDSLCANLSNYIKEHPDYSSLYSLKQIERHLMDTNSPVTFDANANETLVSIAIDLMEDIRKDPLKAEIFQYYVGVEGSSNQADELFGDHHGDLLVFINALDKCHSETVNIKVLGFFTGLFGGGIVCPHLKEMILQKFLAMDLSSLSKWLEFRFLGTIVKSTEDVATAKGSSSSLRDSAMAFINNLVSEPCERLSKEFRSHIVDAMLITLDDAFMFYDLYTAKAYFSCLIQLLNGKILVKRLLERIILLIPKLAVNDGLLQPLKYLLGFLGSILNDHGINKNMSNKISGKHNLSSSFGGGSVVPRQLCTRKSTDAIVLPASQEAGSAAVDCDATSADEDEDDGTSDGELASIDKEEEEDGNTERALASKVCTFTSSGSNFMEQHWYFCYTCDLTVSKGCCSVCAKVCHRGHRVVYSRSSRFFCDCGAGGVRGSSCQCLKPRKYTVIGSAPVRSSNSLQSLLPFSEDGEQTPDTDSDLDDDVFIDIDNIITLSLPIEVQEGFATLLQDLGMEDRVLELCDKLIPNVISRRASNILNDNNVNLGEDKLLSYNVDIFQLKKAYKSGSFDMKIRADYSISRELKGHLTSGSLTKSLLSVSGRGRLAVGEGDKVSIFDVGQLIGQSATASVTADKSNVKPLSKNTVRFEIVHLMFNPVVENYLVVAGYEECMVLTVNPRGEVTDRLAIELASQGAHIRRVAWVPGSQVQLLVVTDMFVKIYDLSLDNISPLHYFTLEDDSIMDATLATALMGKVFLLVLSESGNLFRLELSLKGDVGAKPLKDTLLIPRINSASKGLSVFFSPSHRLLFLSYQDGTTLIGRLDNSAMILSEMSALYENDHDGKHKPAALHHWKELIVDSGIFVCFSSLKLNSALTVSIGRHGILAQNMRHAVGSALPLVGIAAYKPLSKDKTHCLVLHDDGSLQIYSLAYVEADTTVSTIQAKKIGRDILSNKAISGTNPEFPLDFFEKTTCITAEVKLSGEAIKNSDSEGIKQRLASDDGFLESPSPAGFKVTVLNSNPDIVMVGLRLHVGNTSASHIPSEIKIFQRVIKLDEGMRSWYDVPFTDAESLLADEEFTITIGSTLNGSASPRIDSLEVYGRAKDEFGWKEKMDAILDMEADVLVCNSGAIGARKKYRTLKASPIQEQVLADALKLLARFYSLCRYQSSLEVEEPNLELTKLKCKNILEMIFQSDREPLLHSACCHILQAIFPKKEIYNHVKDTMRLVGVLNSTPILASRIGIGGIAARWLINEFTAKTHAVSKIAKLRRSNLSAFLESHGPGIVDGLMDVFWGILDVEQPDTQTIHAIVVPCVELIYSYAECLALQGSDASIHSVAPAVKLLKRLLFASYESVRTSSSLAISSRLLQVPFPKQMMLATDDAIENAALAHMHSDVTGTAAGSAQSVIEDDTATSSVQYCCDGCSTVPILRRRWHCNICPDFDLCEACYEVMDADRLPPPHSRDHPMSAIPIEIESFGDGNEVQFSMEELSAINLMQAQTDIRMHAVPSPIHVLESNESGELLATTTDQKIVSISASKRTVNSLLLRHLIIELKGWMGITSGVRAIPVMQLFYRLSSAVGGPFMDNSKPENLDLKKFVEWFLDEINLGKPFAAKARSFFGEICILVFTYFTLMLRNWHQPGSDSSHLKSSTADMQDRGYSNSPQFISSSSPSGEHDKNEFASQLMHACSFLRQQAFVNYLMDILQQLIPNFKSSSSISENGHSSPSNSGCGSLLTIRRELPAGNFAPFFSDSYGKSHRSDMFMDYHKLLLENTFRLVYSLIRPEKQDKSVERDKIYRTCASKDLKLDGYQDVLCSYISNPNTTFVRRYARRLFLHLCGSKTHYYSIRDSWQLSNETKKLYKLLDKSGGFQSPLSYERSVKLAKCLSAMAEIAVARPRNWQRYCSKHGDILPCLVEGIFSFGEESVVQALKLLSLALYPGKDMVHSIPKQDSGNAGTNSSKPGSQSVDSKKKKKGDDSNEASAEKSFLDMEHAVELFCKDGSVLKNFIDTFLLEWNSASVRTEAKCVLYGAWHHGNRLFKETLLSYLLQKIRCLPLYGQNIVEYIEFVTFLLGKVQDSTKQEENELITQCLTSDVIRGIFETFHSQNVLLANHPNSHIYNTLSGLVEFDGYYLESEPCVACSCPEVPYSRMKLENLKFETKFTDNRIIVKCTGSYTIQSVIMNVHDARKSKSVKVLNLYYNNRPVSDLSELKNNWSLWKRAKSCHLAFNQTELKVDFPIPITACNFMIELDSFYENLQASSLESLQCPRCSRSVTDKHGICSHCHENAYQCRQCRNINYENLDSFLCNECGYSKYGRFEFNFMAKPSFLFDTMENDEDMKKGLAAIESESENAHRRYQQLMGFKRPLLKLLSSVGEHEIDSQQKDTVQQMMVSLPGPSCKINRKIFLLGMLYSEKCKAAFDSVSKSVQTLQGLRRVLMRYLQQKNSDNLVNSTKVAISRSANNCYGCATTFIAHCLELFQALSKHPNCKKQLVSAGILSELFENNIHHGPKTARAQARSVLCSFSEGDSKALSELNILIQKKVMYCIQHHRSIDITEATHEELLLLTEICAVVDEFWESRLRVAFQLLFASIKLGAKHPAISECIILPCLRIISQACTPPKSDNVEKEQVAGKPTLPSKDGDSVNSSLCLSSSSVEVKFSEAPDKHPDDYAKGQDIPLISYYEWERGASYLDFVRRQYKISQAAKATSQRSRYGSHRSDYLALKYGIRWKTICCGRASKGDFSNFELGSWVSELILSACSQSIRAEVSSLISLLCPLNSSRRFQLLSLLMSLLPATLSVGESAAEYFELFFKVIDSETARLFLTAKGCLVTICKLITQEVVNIESQERSLNIDISQGFILHKLVELLNKFLEVPNIRSRFMREDLLSEVLESLLVIRGLIVQKTKLIIDCNRLLKDLLDSLLLESSENKRQFIRACISGLQIHGKEKSGRTCLFILEQLCNMICPIKPEPVYLLFLNKAHTQEEFIRGSMNKNPYSNTEIGPLMRDVKNKICHQLDLLGLLEDDYGMELLVAGNIISLDLSISQVYEQVWKKSQSQLQNTVANSALLSPGGVASNRECPPMTVTYRLQGLDGEATEPMIKELEEEREESQDPEVEFAIAGAVREFGGLEIILSMVQSLRDDLKSNQEELVSVLNLLMYCCKIRENRRALLCLGALGLLLDTARNAFSVDAMEPAEGILLIVESLTMEANESDISITQSVLRVSNEESGAGEQAKKIVLMFLERLSHSSGLKRSNKQQRNNEMVARILPYLTYGEPAAMEALIQHFDPYLQDWSSFDHLQKHHQENPRDESFAQQAGKQRSEVENFVRVSESLKTSSCGDRLKDIILEKGITATAVKYLRESFSVTRKAGFKTSAEWLNGLKLPSIPLILSMLKGLSRGHLATQRHIDEGGIVPLLHALEGVSGENEIGARAENLLDTLSDKGSNGDGFLREKVHKLRHATRNEMRQRALKKREELLQGLGMRQELSSDGGERIVVSQPVIEGLEDVEEEKDGLACMVCREGYTLRPNDVLGVYSFSKRVNLGASSSGSSRGDCVYTTVSHFNIIHFQCHQEAKRADMALKNPKKEWEGAALRNHETLCNCIFPIRGPAVPLAQYIRCVDQYWDNLNALGRAEGSRLRLLTYDIVLMLARFATGASFSIDSKGGGRESNSRLLPFMIQMACHLLDQGNSSQQRRSMAKSISTYLSSSRDSPSRSPSVLSGSRNSSGSSDDTVQFVMVNSLLSESYDEWTQHLPAFLQRGIYHAYMQHTHGRSTFRLSSDPASSVVRSNEVPETHQDDSGKLFRIVHPMLIYTGLIGQLQQFLKLSRSAGVGTSKESDDSGGCNFERWEVVMREKLVNIKEMVNLSKELLSWLEDMTSASDLQEAFDVMGALGVVLSGGFSTCEEFVQAAVTSGKN